MSTPAPVPSRRRRLAALGAAGVLAGTALSLSAVTASPADAAWSTQTTVHGAKAQVCKVPVRGQRPWLRLRLDNRAAPHGHEATLSRAGGGRVTVRAAAGRVSGTQQLRWRTGDRFGTGVNDIDGPGAGGGVDLSRVPRC